MTNELIEQAEAILKDIENETDPLRCCLHYRNLVELVPELVQAIKDLEDQYYDPVKKMYVNVYRK